MNDSDNLLFDGVSSKQWKQKIQFELNGAPYSSVVHHDNEQIPIRPFYHFDENIPRYNLRNCPGPKIIVPIFVSDVDKTIERIDLDISEGISQFILTFKNPSDSLVLLEKVKSKNTFFYIQGTSTFEIDSVQLKQLFPDKNIVVLIDPIFNLSKSGNWHSTMEKDLSLLSADLLSPKTYSYIGINTSVFQNAGATIIEQLGLGMACLAEYLNRCSNLHSTIYFTVSVGSNYFFEIAKIKALRLLFKVIVDEFKIPANCHISAIPSKRNKSWIDSDNNTIRKATEYVSAILAGADSLQTQTADFIYKKETQYTSLFSKHQLLILLEEFNLNQENNPTEGCYYIDYLTHQLAQKGLNLFKEIERKGGYLHLLKIGDIQKRIRESSDKEQELFDNETIKSIGISLHQDSRSISTIQKPELYPFTKINVRKTIIKPIVEKRLAEKIEKEIFEGLD